MDATASCRGIPLLKVPAVAGGTAVAVHQLSIHLWKSFDTPRASVQRKIEELKIPLIQCSKAQLRLLRDHGVVSGFRATLVSLQDAERVCDALKRSREKRGLSKHPIKAKLGRRAEEKSLVKMKARKRSDGGLLTAVKEDVDGCALIGSNTTPTTIDVASDSSDSPPQAQLTIDLLLVAEENNRLLEFSEDEVIQSLNDYTPLQSYLSHAQSLEALDLCVAGSQRMASLRNHVGRPRKINGKSGSTGNLYLSSTREKPRPLISPLRTTATSHHRSPSTRNTPNKKGSHIASTLNGRDYRSGLRSPALATEGEELVNGGGAEICRRSEQGSKRNGRFLFLSSEEEEEDVVVLKVERNTRIDDSVSAESKAPRPYPRRLIATKLRHFAQTCSPPTAAAAASPGKQLPFGSTHSSSSSSSSSSPRQHHTTNTFVVSISRSLLKAASSTTPKESSAPSSTSSAPSGHNMVTPQPRKRGRPPLNKSRPKPSLSSFATMKRARIESPPSSPSPPAAAASETPPTKRQKVSSAEMASVQRLSKSADSAVVVPVPKARKEKSMVMAEASSKESPNSEGASRGVALGGGASSRGMALGGGASSRGVALGGGASSRGVAAPGGKSSCKTLLNGVGEEEGTSNGSSSSIMTEVCNRLHNIKQRGPKSAGSSEGRKQAIPESSGTINFDELFNYYPPKLVVQDGDLCPEHSLSVSGIERSKLSPTHPFWSWTMGQPISKAPAPAVKATRRKLKSKATN